MPAGVPNPNVAALAQKIPSGPVFITGPGFIGTRLLQHYLSHEIQISLLIQEKYRPEIERVLQQARATQTVKADVVLLKGDITRPRMGLSDKDFAVARLAKSALHMAAAYHLELKKNVGQQVNVEGTKNVLDALALFAGLEHFGYFSTIAVSGSHQGVFSPEELDVGQKFNNHYARSKFVAEQLVRDRMTDIPTTVLDPVL